jgi:hypothetical protein
MKTSELLFLIVVMTVVVVVTATAHCQEPPKFLTKQAAGLLVLDAAAKSMDAYYTRRNVVLDRGVEHDPLIRPFAHSLPATVGWAGGFYALDIFTAYELHKHGHDRWAKVALSVGFTTSAMGAAQSGRQ